MINCPYCGTQLQRTSHNRLWCPNCGIVEETTPEDKEGERSYIQ